MVVFVSSRWLDSHLMRRNMHNLCERTRGRSLSSVLFSWLWLECAHPEASLCLLDWARERDATVRRLQRTPDVLITVISRESSLLPLEMHLTAFDVPQSGCVMSRMRSLAALEERIDSACYSYCRSYCSCRAPTCQYHYVKPSSRIVSLSVSHNHVPYRRRRTTGK